MRSVRIFGVLLPALLSIIAFTVSVGSGQDANTFKSKPKLPDISLATIEGGNWKLSDQLGRTVILNFWATWCEPCRTEVPYLLNLSKEFEESGLRVFGVNLDEEGGEKVRRFIAEFKLDYPILVPPKGSPFWKLEEVPTTLLIDSAGRLVKRYTGAVPEDELRKDVLALVAPGPGVQPK